MIVVCVQICCLLLSAVSSSLSGVERLFGFAEMVNCDNVRVAAKSVKAVLEFA